MTLPAFLEPHLAARNTTTVGELSVAVREGAALLQRRRSVRRHRHPGRAQGGARGGAAGAGLASDGADAIARLEREKRALEAVAGTGVVPEVRDSFLGDHRFLVMDFVAGPPLNSFFAERHPLLSPDPDPQAVAAYTAWAVSIHRAVECAVEKVHARGIVFNDLHVFNIVVAPDEESVFLIDFEAAARPRRTAARSWRIPGSSRRRTAGAPTSTGTRWRVCVSPCSCPSPRCSWSTGARRPIWPR